MPTYCNDTTCVAEHMTIRGSLDVPARLSPAPIPAPPGSDTPNCLVKSQLLNEPVWNVTRFLYKSTKRAVIWSTEWDGILYPFNRTLEVELHNLANGVTQSCTFNDPVLDELTDRWWPCFSVENPHEFPQRAIETYVSFNRDTGVLLVNQTWYCNDTQEGAPYVLSPSPCFMLAHPIHS